MDAWAGPSFLTSVVAEPFPTTVQLPPADVGAIVSDVGGVLRFDRPPAALAGVQIGHVLVGGVGPQTPSGLLRVVLAIEQDGSALVLRTAQAPIQLAYRKLDVRFVRSLLATPSTAQGTSRADVEATRQFDFVLYDGDGSPPRRTIASRSTAPSAAASTSSSC